MTSIKKELMLNSVYVVCKETGTIEPFNPEKHLETLAHIYAAYMTIRSGIPYRVITDKETPDEILTATQVAKILGLSRTHVYEIMRRNDFPTIRLSDKESGAKRIFRSDLMQWLRDRREYS